MTVATLDGVISFMDDKKSYGGERSLVLEVFLCFKFENFIAPHT